MAEGTNSRIDLQLVNDTGKILTGNSLSFDLFNKKILVDLDLIQELLRSEFPESTVEFSEIEKYLKWQLLPECYNEDGTRGYPLYTYHRIDHVKQLIEKWQYTPAQLKYFTDFEEVAIDEALTSDELDYPDLSDFEYWKAVLEWEIRINRYELKSDDNFGSRRRIKSRNKKLQQMLKAVDGKNFGELNEKTRDSIEKRVLHMKHWNECIRITLISEIHAKAYLGFSPNVSVSNTGTVMGEHSETPNFIKSSQNCATTITLPQFF